MRGCESLPSPSSSDSGSKGKLCQHYTQDRLHNTHYYTLQESITYKCNKPLCPVVHPYQNIENMKILTLLQLTNIILETYRVINLGHPTPNPAFSVTRCFFVFTVQTFTNLSETDHSCGPYCRLCTGSFVTVFHYFFTLCSTPSHLFLNLRLLIKPQAVNLGGTDQWFPLL